MSVLVTGINVLLLVASNLQDSYERSSHIPTLNIVISVYRTIQEQTTEASSISMHTTILNSLGRALIRRYQTFGDHADIEAALSILRQAVDFHHDASDDLSTTLINLAEALCTDYEVRATPSAPSEAVSLGRKALDYSRLGTRGYSAATINLGRVLVCEYLQTGSPNNLYESLTLARAGLQICTKGSDLLPNAHFLLGLVLFYKVRLSSDEKEVGEAEEAASSALSLQPPGHPARHKTLNLLCVIMDLKFQLFGDNIQLDRALQFAKQVLELRPLGHPGHATCLTNLGTFAHSRWNHLGDPRDLDDAIFYAGEALKLRPVGDPKRWYALNNLAVALLSRFMRFGVTRMDDVDESCRLNREALATHHRGHFCYIASLDGLACLLLVRYSRMGNPDDLEEAIARYQEALELYDSDHFLRGEVVINLAECLFQRYKRLGGYDDLIEGVNLLRANLTTLDARHPGRPHDLALLGDFLIARFDKQQSLSDIDEAILLLSEASSTSAFHELLPDTLCSLAKAYLKRSLFLASDDDAAFAMEICERALGCYPPHHPDRAICFFQQATILLEQTPPSVTECLSKISQAVTDVNCNPQARLLQVLPLLDRIGAQELGCREEVFHLMEIYWATVRLLPQVAYFGMQINTRLRALAKVGNTITKAIAYGALCSRLEQALEILEESRSVFWSQALRLRTSFEELPDDLRGDMVALSSELEHESFLVSNSTGGPSNLSALGNDEDTTRRRKQGERLQLLITQARSLPGFERFMLHDEFSTLKDAAAGGPVVCLVPSVLSCDALAVRSGGELVRVRLHGVSVEWLEQASATWNATIGQTRSSIRLKVAHKRVRDPRLQMADAQRSTLNNIWIKIVEPVLQALQLQRATGRGRPRLWWCCSGAFAFLPIHAAGSWDVSCSDYVASSYTPSLGSLIKARRMLVDIRREDVKVLLAATPDPIDGEGFTVLQEAVIEVSKVSDIIPPAARLSLSPEEDALSPAFTGGITTATFLENVPKATVVHIACHGSQDAINPLNSAFILRDGRLSIARLMPMSLPNAQLAFLSACETVKGDKTYSEENIHLGAAMLFAGFKSVVGTMWTMDDVDGPTVAKTVYERLFEGDSEYLELDRVPYALDEAVRKLREQGLPPGRWATYIHLGL